MEATIIGSGSPIPDPERAGTSIAVDIGHETVLVDCGQGSYKRMLELGFNPKNFETLFFTHHHADHNADFFSLVIGSWTLGRQRMTLYGPDGTEDLVDAMHNVYEQDFEYRATLDRETEGVENIETVQLEPGFEAHLGECRVSALQVEHSIETYALRFDHEGTGESLVFSADTRKNPELIEFATNADVLIQDACIGPLLDQPPTDKPVWNTYLNPSEAYQEGISAVHTDATECGEIASAAGVGTLVLTHFTPYIDTEAAQDQAQAVYDGPVLIAEDGLTLSSPL